MFEGKKIYILNKDGDMVNFKTGEVVKETSYGIILVVKLKKIYRRRVRCVVEKELPADMAIAKLREFISSERPDLTPNQIEIFDWRSVSCDPDYESLGKLDILDEVQIDSQGCHNYKWWPHNE